MSAASTTGSIAGDAGVLWWDFSTKDIVDSARENASTLKADGQAFRICIENSRSAECCSCHSGQRHESCWYIRAGHIWND